MKHVLLTLILLTSCTSWTHDEIATEVAALAATGGDWYESRGITAHCDEGNPILGACGDRVPVNLYFPVMMVAHVAVAAVLPHRWRLLWSAVTAGAEINQVWINYQIAHNWATNPASHVLIRISPPVWIP